MFGTDATEQELDPLKNSDPQKARTVLEQQYRFGYMSEPLLEGEGLPGTRPSYGRFAPFYGDQLRRLGQKKHKSLLVGAITEDSPREAKVVLNRALSSQGPVKHKGSQPSPGSIEVIDLWASDEMRHALRRNGIQFIEGNFLTGPSLQPNQYDSVQTNMLLEDIRDVRGNISQDNQTRKKFYQSAAKVLKQNGMLLMVESSDDRAFAQNLQQELLDAGFTDIQITFPALYLTRRSVDRFLGGQGYPTQTFRGQGKNPQEQGLYGIRAIKQ